MMKTEIRLFTIQDLCDILHKSKGTVIGMKKRLHEYKLIEES